MPIVAKVMIDVELNIVSDFSTTLINIASCKSRMIQTKAHTSTVIAYLKYRNKDRNVLRSTP